MKAFVAAYNAVIIFIAVVMTWMLVKRGFRTDIKLLIAIIGSAITFPLTAWFLYSFYNKQKHRTPALVFLVLSLLIFSYALSDLLFHKIDGISLLMLLIVGIVFILTIAFLIDLFGEKNKKQEQ